MKTYSFRALFLLFPVVFLLSSCQNPSESDQRPIVIMLSLDGFRWDYPDLYSTPNLDRIAGEGVRAHGLIPSFPTKTFPNHFSMATGLYPDNHGLVNNTYFDPQREKIFRLSDREKVEDPYYYGGEPIWVTAEKQGVRTASFFWVGSEAAIKGIQPSIWKRFDDTIPFETRMDSVMSWLDLPDEQRPHLITWYMEEPDHIGHNYGPFSPETEHVISYLDSLIGIFYDRVKAHPLADKVNVIITSDHGMGETKSDMYIDIDRNIPEEWLTYILGYNPVIFLEPKPEFTDSVYTVLKETDHINVWKKNEIPAHLNYGTNERISSLVVAADSGWSIGTKSEPGFSLGGAHGYDIKNSDMHAIFYASGPDFRQDYIHPEFYNVDIYSLLAALLRIEPAATDGNFQRVTGMLKEKDQ